MSEEEIKTFHCHACGGTKSDCSICRNGCEKHMMHIYVAISNYIRNNYKKEEGK